MKLGLAFNDQFPTGVEEYSPHYDTDAERHFVPSLLLAFPLDRWRLVPTLSVVEKGGYASYNVRDTLNPYVYPRHIHSDLWYISFQGDVHYEFPLGNASFYMLAAPRLDVLVAKGEPYLSPVYGSNTVPLSPPSYRPVTLGLALGLGQDISLGRHVLCFEFRYDRDLTSYVSAPEAGTTAPTEDFPIWYNRMFLIQMGVRLNATPPDPEKTELWPPH